MRAPESFRFSVKGTPKKVLQLVEAYARLRRQLLPSLGRQKALFRISLAVACLLTAGGAAFVFWTDGFSAGAEYFFALVGLGVFSSVFLEAVTRCSRSPVIHPRLAPESSFAPLIAFVLFSIFFGAFVGPAYWDLFVEPLPYARVEGAVNAGAAAATAWVVAWLQRQRALRRENVVPNEPEVRWLGTTLAGLLQGLGPEVRCSVVCNPFPSLWSEEQFNNMRQRGGYTYPGAVDTLLDLNLDFGQGRRFRLAVTNAYMNKIKDRKSKYKGTKYRARNVYSFARPGAAAWNAATTDAFRRTLMKRLPLGPPAGGAGPSPLLSIYAPGPDATLRTDVRQKGECLEVVLTAKAVDSSRGRSSLFVSPELTVAAARQAAALLEQLGSGAGEGAPE